MTQLTLDSSFSTKITTAITFFHAKPDIYVSDLTQEVVTFVINLIIAPLLSVFGIITNIISIIVFTKLGFSDSVNIALLGLSLSDLLLLVVILWQWVLSILEFPLVELPFDPIDIAHVTAGLPLTYFSRTTSWITAFITLERYICVAFPLKVKTWSSPRRSTFIVLCIYVLMAATVAPLFYTNQLIMKYFPEKNTSKLGHVFTSDRYYIAKYINPFNNIIVQLGSFFFVVVFTVLLVIKLRNNNKWREKAGDKVVLLSRRDQKVAIMIILVSSNFIICYAGITTLYIWQMFAPELSSGLAYKNILLVFGVSAIMTQQITASTYLFIYVKMSSKYRRVVHSMCGCLITKSATSPQYYKQHHLKNQLGKT